MKMKSINEVSTHELIRETANDLMESKSIEKPQWADYVKTGVSKTRSPQDNNWWWVRAASILRTIQVEGPIGVEKLRKKYGGKQNRGRKPEKYRKAGGKIIRTILQQLDELGYTEKVKTGRRISPKGQSYLSKMIKKLET